MIYIEREILGNKCKIYLEDDEIISLFGKLCRLRYNEHHAKKENSTKTDFPKLPNEHNVNKEK